MLAVSYWHVHLLRGNLAPQFLLHRSLIRSFLCHHNCHFLLDFSNNNNKKVIQPLTFLEGGFSIHIGLVLWLVRALRNPTSFLSY